MLDAVAGGAWFAFNLSGGKDSSAAAQTAITLLDRLGHPRSRRIAIHADLGRAEWRSTPSTVAAVADRLGLPLVVVRRSAGDMVARWEQRFANGCRRYENLELYDLIGPWSSASLRFCTSELKAQVIGPELARRYRGETIVSVIGLRRAESAVRRDTPVSKLDPRFAKPGNRAATRMVSWHPLVDWSEQQVFACHDRHGLPPMAAMARRGFPVPFACWRQAMISPPQLVPPVISISIVIWSRWRHPRPSRSSQDGGWLTWLRIFLPRHWRAT